MKDDTTGDISVCDRGILGDKGSDVCLSFIEIWIRRGIDNGQRPY